MIIKIYVYNPNNLAFLYEDKGDADTLIADVENKRLGFTLQPPPDYRNQWQWDGLRWIKTDSPL
ncbi:hypothetical protein MN210_03450 [Psychrobacter raelei]|uniref:Uncharacterized protein n=1 Tax=Psychrobacter raelei TaxID=2565531 RepID=A0AAT9PEW2_9GAMM|nr:hypothetical protein [Psychrobacter sp. PraFG1]UNK05854.1 hypothetical protein MN210_03450 [Psychrobacter sp. PraFG1]